VPELLQAEKKQSLQKRYLNKQDVTGGHCRMPGLSIAYHEIFTKSKNSFREIFKISFSIAHTSEKGVLEL